MQKLKKSYSNPTKIRYYSPAYNGSKIATESNRGFLNKSQEPQKLNKSLSSASKKFGIREVSQSPVSRKKKLYSGSSNSKITINTANLNLIFQEKTPSSKMISPASIHSQRNRPNKDYFASRMNYFKASKLGNQPSIRKAESHRESKKNKIISPFNFQPIKKLANGQYGGLYLAY